VSGGLMMSGGGLVETAVSALPATTRRVEENTAEAINRRIQSQTETRIRHFAAHPEAIDRRLSELDREWDIERALEANAATLALTGTLLAAFVDRRFLLLPAAVAAFLLQHAIQGWCPPVPLLRSLGVRTASEIARERFAIKALRGDFRATHTAMGRVAQAEAALEAVGAR
jgi:hypothetical protein